VKPTTVKKRVALNTLNMSVKPTPPSKEPKPSHPKARATSPEVDEQRAVVGRQLLQGFLGGQVAAVAAKSV
jgi:hypothetical protein